MTQDDIIRMAREAYAKDQLAHNPSWRHNELSDALLEDFQGIFKTFAQMILAHEREECAKLVDYWEAKEGEHADAIRARGNK